MQLQNLDGHLGELVLTGRNQPKKNSQAPGGLFKAIFNLEILANLLQIWWSNLVRRKVGKETHIQIYRSAG